TRFSRDWSSDVCSSDLSTMAVFLPRLARLTARFVVTEDLPTPPLPEATSSTRVLEPGSAKGMVRPSAWPWAAWLPAVALGSPTIDRKSVVEGKGGGRGG